VAEGDQLILTKLDVLYRDPSETISAEESQGRQLAINQTHDLPEFLDDQKQSLITILDCAGNSGSK
jgi:hypothetical protein